MLISLSHHPNYAQVASVFEDVDFCLQQIDAAKLLLLLIELKVKMKIKIINMNKLLLLLSTGWMKFRINYE